MRPPICPHTMAAMDTALGRVERVAGWLGGEPRATPTAGDEIPPGEPPSPESAEPQRQHLRNRPKHPDLPAHAAHHAAAARIAGVNSGAD